MSKALALLAVGLLTVAFVFPQIAERLPAGVTNSALQMSNVENEIPSWIAENFKQWKMTHNKAYESLEVELYRMAVYYSNFIYIEMENARQSEYELGANAFMDLTQEEFTSRYLSFVPEDYEYPTQTEDFEYVPTNGVKNWITEGKVGPVLNQGSCGSCWAYSAAETVQSFWSISKGSLPSLSEQQLVDCTGSYGNQGCNGGWPSYALNYVKASGITTTAAYPYTGRDGACRTQGGAYKVSQVKTSAGCGALTNNINVQPTSVCVDATNWSFYKSGVFSNCAANINHAVLAVGYDNSGNWIIQNSWGTSWGQQGYMTLKTGDTCAICEYMANAY
jgi:C1A family cysteine protease